MMNILEVKAPKLGGIFFLISMLISTSITVHADTINEFNRGRDTWRDLSSLGLVSKKKEADAINNLWARYWAQKDVASLPPDSQPLVDGLAAAVLASPGDTVTLSNVFFDPGVLVGLFDSGTLSFINSLGLTDVEMGIEGILAGDYLSAQVGNPNILSVDYFWSDNPFGVPTPGPGDMIDLANFQLIGSSFDPLSNFSVLFDIPTSGLSSDVIDIRAVAHFSGGGEMVGFASLVTVPEPSSLALVSLGFCGVVISRLKRRSARKSANMVLSLTT